MNSSISLDPVIENFVSSLDTTKPISSLSPFEARDVLRTTQNVTVEIPPVSIEQYILPIESGVYIKIVRPEDTLNELLPIVMYFHGGGWILGDFQVFQRLVSELAFYTGYAVVFVEYTPSPEAQYPVPIQQAYAATKYISENATKYSLDANKLAVAGDSVGGNMAIAVTLLAKDLGTPKIDLQVLFYPVTDDNFNTASYKKYRNGPWLTKNSMEWFWNAYAADISTREFTTIRPLRADINQLKGLPQALIITAEHDVLRDEGEAYAHKLLKAGVPTLSMRYLGAIHDFLMLNGIAHSTVTRSALSVASQYIRDVFEY